MNILGFDCSGNACSVAILRGAELVAHRHDAMARGHAEALMPMIRSAMQEAGLGFAELDRIAVTVGPGAFTGIRIGLAAARGLALAADRPAIGITAFEALREAVEAGRPVLAAIDSRRDELFLQEFDATGAPVGAPVAALPGSVSRWAERRDLVVSGDGATRAAPLLPHADIRAMPVDARFVAAIAQRRDPAAGPPRPLYLRGADVTLPSGERTTAE